MCYLELGTAEAEFHHPSVLLFQCGTSLEDRGAEILVLPEENILYECLPL